MSGFILHLHRIFAARKGVLILATVTVTALCAFFTSQLSIKEDIRALLPTASEELMHSFDLLSSAPFSQVMTISVAVDDKKDFTATKTFAHILEQDPHITKVFKGTQQIRPIQLARELISVSPALLPESAYIHFAERTSIQAIEQSLSAIHQTLQTTSGMGAAPIFALDPLGLTKESFKNLTKLSAPGGPRLHDGYILDQSQRYALIIAQSDLPMTDTASSRHVMDTLREAQSALPEGTDSFWAGGYPYTEANAKVIQEDLLRVIPISVLVLALSFAFFLRSLRAMTIFLVPIIAFTIACAAAALIFQSISGIVVGFGSVILGIASDYPIHVYYSLRASPTPEQGLRRVIPPILLGMVTTIGIFASFFVSDIPALNQMATLAIIGVATAAFCALLIVPVFTVTNKPQHVTYQPIPRHPKNGLCLIMLWCVLLGSLGWFMTHGEVDGDIRRLAYTSKQIRHDEDKTREVWSNMREGALIAVQADSLEIALQKNDAVWQVLETNEATQGTLSLAPLLPSIATQNKRLALWSKYWETHRDETLQRVITTADALGFSNSAFTPFTTLISTPPATIQLETLQNIELGDIVSFLMAQQPHATTIYTSVAESASLTPALVTELESVGASIVSGDAFRASMSQITQKDFFLFIAIALVIITAFTTYYYKNIFRTALVLLPPVISLTFILIIFYCLSYPMQIFHAIAMPLVLTLSVDYGIFMVAFLEGTLDKDTPEGVLLSALTTIGGFGCLIFAQHPALFSIGIVVTGGITMAILSSIFLLPLFIGKRQ